MHASLHYMGALFWQVFVAYLFRVKSQYFLPYITESCSTLNKFHIYSSVSGHLGHSCLHAVSPCPALPNSCVHIGLDMYSVVLEIGLGMTRYTVLRPSRCLS